MWRTIAQFIGRTTQQCIEKYEKLLDIAQGRDPNDPSDARDRLAGEIDPNPETKPSRPDPIDMDEDEKEMLQECRARLANTKGKKATRKVREKKLEEARRLAQLQKQRELKQAGINIYRPIKIKGVDYNKEVPFMANVPIGRHAVGAEETPEIDVLKSNTALKQIEAKLRDEEERRKRALDLKRLNKLKQKNLPKAIEQTNGQKNAQLLQFNTKMSLPQPTISETELNNIGKYAIVGSDSSFAVPQSRGKNQSASQILLGEYSQREILASVRQGQAPTPLVSERIMKGAQDALALRESQTPLVGGQNPHLNQELADIQTPIVGSKRKAAEAIKKSEFEIPSTPKRPRVPVEATPLRDQMRLNQDVGQTEAWEKSSIASGYTSVMGSSQARIDIKAKLSALPAPQNKVTQSITDDQIARLEADVAMTEQREKTRAEVEKTQIDEEQRQEKLVQEEKAQREEEKRRMSSVMRKGLPRPTVISKEAILGDSDDQTRVEKLINEEMLVLMVHDNSSYPLKGMKASQLPALEREKTQYSSKELDHARQLISQQAQDQGLDSLDEVWPEHLDKEAMFFRKSQTYDWIKDHPEDEVVSCLRHKLAKANKAVDREAKKCKKYTSAVDVLFKKYKEMAGQTNQHVSSLAEKRSNKLIEKEVFSTLSTLESKHIVSRQQELQRTLRVELKRERMLQERYQATKDRLQKLRKQQKSS